MVPLLMNYIGQANDASLKSEAATALTQVQADFAASQATAQTGMKRPGASGYTAPAGLTVAEDATKDTEVVDADIKGKTTKTAVYHAAKNAQRGNYEEITSFGYSSGSKYIIWTSTGTYYLRNYHRNFGVFHRSVRVLLLERNRLPPAPKAVLCERLVLLSFLPP